MSPAAYTVHRRQARRWILAAWLLLIGLLVLWWASSQRWPPGTAGAAAGLMILPLVLLTPALSRGSRSASAGATLLLTPYIGFGITEMVANPASRTFAAATVLLAVLCFVLLIYWLRVLRSG